MTTTASQMAVPFSQPDVGDAELASLAESLRTRKLSGDGPFTQRCHDALEAIYGPTALLVHSGTAALELAALLIDLQPGDEVIMPSFTFTSTANAIALRGAVPVFVDVRADTLNIDERQIEAAITPRTKAILPVHYAGVSAEMSTINDIAKRNQLFVIEDAAQGYGARYKGTPLGAIGDIGCLSFHETKNITSGEGGAIIIKNPELAQRARYIREKGTNRTAFLRGEVVKYEWIDIGSSYLPSDLIAALLLVQLQRGDGISARRMSIWQSYYSALAPLGNSGLILPVIPSNLEHNAHIFCLRMPNGELQKRAIQALRAKGVQATTHYVPLHSTPAGRRFGRAAGTMVRTDLAASTLVRLPLYSGLSDEQVAHVTSNSLEILGNIFDTTRPAEF